MQIFLPPSEGKTAPDVGPTLNFEALAFPQLTPLRKELANELIEVSRAENACDILKVGTSVAPEVLRQQDILTCPTARALDVYTGVLYSALDPHHLTEADWARAHERLVIFSGLFGILSPCDFIPSYRLKMGITLPGGNNAARWRLMLSDVGSQLLHDSLIVDARSGPYRVFTPRGSRVVEIRVERIKDGKRRVVSHDAKRYRGLLAGALIREPNAPTTVEEIAEFAYILVDAGHISRLELRNGPTTQLTLIDHVN
ncbi:YaaA family protein [Arcanobacterium canis]